MSTRVRISEALVSTYEAFITTTTWLTSQEVASVVEIAPRTAREHLKVLTDKNIIEVQRLAPNFRYRLKADRADSEFEQQLKLAKESLK